MSERHGASRRWDPEPAANAVPLTIRIFRLDNALGSLGGSDSSPVGVGTEMPKGENE